MRKILFWILLFFPINILAQGFVPGKNPIILTGITAPGVSTANQARIYYNGTDVYISKNTGAYTVFGASGGTVGPGTVNKIAKFTAATTVGDSACSDDGTTFTCGGGTTITEATGATKIGNLTSGSVLFSGAAGLVSQDNANFFWDDSNNRLGIGITAPLGRLHLSEDASTNAFVDAYSSAGSFFHLRQSNGTAAAPTTTVVNDVLGTLNFAGRAEAGFGTTAQIIATASDAWVHPSRGTRMTLLTTPNGTFLPVERVRIENDGNVGIGDTSPTALLTVAPGDLFQVSSAGNITMNGDLTFLPTTDNNGTVGSAAKRFKLISGATVVSGDLHLKDDERSLHWVIREEEDGISVVNKKTGKRYRMAMVEDGEDAVTKTDESLWHHLRRAVGLGGGE